MKCSLLALTFTAGAAGLALPLAAQSSHALAHKLVADAMAAHADVTEIGILLPSGGKCTTIASTDKSDQGEACESDDIQPLKTHKPSVGVEGNSYAVSVLLHDTQGRQVGVASIEIKRAGHTRSSALAEARKIEAGMARQIPSKSALAGN